MKFDDCPFPTDGPYRAIPSRSIPEGYNTKYVAVGAVAEKLIIDWLKQNPEVLHVDDLRDLRPMRRADVDCSLILRSGQVGLVEIKSDWHLGVSGNLIFEVTRIYHGKRDPFVFGLGWSAKTPATWILFYAPQKQEIWAIRGEDYRRFVETAIKADPNVVKVRVIPTNENVTTIALIVPESVFEAGIKRYALKPEAPK